MSTKKKLYAGTLAVLLGAATIFNAGIAKGEAETADNKYLVIFKDQQGLPSGYADAIKKAGGQVEDKLDKLGAVEVTSTNANFLKEVKKSALVLEAGVENIVYPEQTIEGETVEVEDLSEGADFYNQYMWDIKQVTNNGESWTLPGGTGKSVVEGEDIVVGVIDTGIDYNHPDLKDNYAGGKSFVPGYSDPIDQNSHGTHVAGSIAAKGSALGVGPDLKVASYRVFGPTGGAETSHIADALMTAADDNVDVVNMSLGGYDWFQNPDYATKDIVADVHLFNRAIQYAIQKGVTVVGSAGNNAVDLSSPGKLSGDDTGATHRSPSSQTMIRVSAGGALKNLAFYSNYGVGKIDVMAPGGDLGPNYDPSTGAGRDNSYLAFSTVPLFDANKNVIGHGYGAKGGTSMAAPKTAALAGVIIAKHGKDKLTPAQVKAIIQNSAEDVFKPGYDAESGHGLINAVNALNNN
ncbi:S8 family serine peptidase [Mesobacillus subterraneus]|uniref:S8 family peptidase n=1 Tax=Mesobacillus subterraneus TaxID=285983 RepID=UPI00203F17A6|nr:S8 family serine peptidase [Mesobacillus subterraneus]MCM3664314.1 S8 family serine peptidase [Mesobacillus subterraneus]MCM3682341.1 S8 family serine peptidase [Mesobacillus subterraneus]